MDFVTGKAYQNASGQFRVVSVGVAMVKLEYATGPQAGKVLIKRIADMAKLATTELLAPPPPVAKRKASDRTR